MKRLTLLNGLAAVVCTGLVQPQVHAQERASPEAAISSRVAEPAPVRVANSASVVARERQMPIYPPALVAEKREGRVFASFDVDETGKTDDIRIERSSHPLFSQAVVEALKGWRFDPPLGADGKARRTRMQVPFRFLPDE